MFPDAALGRSSYLDSIGEYPFAVNEKTKLRHEKFSGFIHKKHKKFKRIHYSRAAKLSAGARYEVSAALGKPTRFGGVPGGGDTQP